MKIALLAATGASFLASACAFAPTAFVPRPSTRLAVEIDATKAIEDARAASKEFGSASPEARAAWDIVEEIDAASRHHKADDIHVKQPGEAKKSQDPTVYQQFCAENDSGDVKEAMRRVKALADAKKISEEKGASSPEARLAWELVEELAATETHHKTSGTG